MILEVQKRLIRLFLKILKFFYDLKIDESHFVLLCSKVLTSLKKFFSFTSETIKSIEKRKNFLFFKIGREKGTYYISHKTLFSWQQLVGVSRLFCGYIMKITQDVT